jgi:uncharacterized protein (TIGR02246 family)
MSRIVAPAILIIAALVATGCDRGRHDRNGPGKADTAVIADQIRALEAEWNKDFVAKDAGKLVSHYSPDASFVAPGLKLTTGSDALNATYGQLVTDPNLKVQFSSDRVQVARSGDLAYSRGHVAITTTDPKTTKPVTKSGSYLTVWQRQADGSWKAVEDFNTEDPPAG